jgi:uncharacterized protein YcgL (UPF0745 family)
LFIDRSEDMDEVREQLTKNGFGMEKDKEKETLLSEDLLYKSSSAA